MSEGELERLEDKARALELMDELGIYGRMREEMLSDVSRSVAVLEGAKSATGARNRAALAISHWRRGADPRPRPDYEPELVEEPPTLSALEYAWSRESSPIGASLLAMMGYSIERHGGASEMLRAHWWTRQRFDDDGELVSRSHAVVDLEP